MRSGTLDVLLPPFAAPHPSRRTESVQSPRASALPAGAQPAWLEMLDSLDDEETFAESADQPVVEVAALLAPVEEEASHAEGVPDIEAAAVASIEEDGVPGWMTWDPREEADEQQPDADPVPAPDLAESEATQAVGTAADDEAEYRESAELSGTEAHIPESPQADVAAAADPVDAAPAMPAPSADAALIDLADRLERIAGALRTGGVQAIAQDGSDPLALLVTGFALGSLQRNARG